MKLQSLKLKNFGAIKNAEFSFDEGIFLFSGGNGQGKSTILKAFSLLNFNKFRGKLQDYVHWDADQFDLEETFTHKGRKFSYTMVYNGKGSTRVLTVDDKEVFSNSDAVAKMAEEIDPALALASAISFAGEIDVVNTSDSERRDHLKKIFTVDFSSSVESLKDEQTRIDRDIQELEKKIYALTEKEYNYRKLQRPPFSESKYIEKKDLKNNLTSVKLNTEKARQEWERLQTEKQNLQSSRDRLEEKLRTTVKEKIALIERLQESRTELEVLEAPVEQTTSPELKEALEEKSEIENSLGELSEEPVPSVDEDRYNFIKEQVDRHQEKIRSSEYRLLLAEKGKCPECGQPFEGDYVEQCETELAHFRTELTPLTEEKDELEAQIEERTKVEKANENVKTERKLLQSQLSSLTDRIKGLQSSLKSEYESKKSMYEKDLDFYSQKIEDLENQLSRQESVENEIRKDIQEAEKSITELSTRLENEKPFFSDEQEEELAQLDRACEEYENVIRMNEYYQKENKALQEEEKLDKENLQSLKDEESVCQERLVNVQAARKILSNEFPSFVISTLVESLQDYVNDFLHKTYGGRYTIKIKETKKTLKMVYGPKDQDVSLASDYERQVFSMAYKYALSQLNGLGLIILDEVDSFAEEKNSEIFYETLGNMQDLYSQIFVITHRENTKSILESDYGATVYTLKDGKVE